MDAKSEEIVKALEDLVEARDQAREQAKEKILEVFKNQRARITDLEDGYKIILRNIEGNAVGIHWIKNYIERVIDSK